MSEFRGMSPHCDDWDKEDKLLLEQIRISAILHIKSTFSEYLDEGLDDFLCRQKSLFNEVYEENKCADNEDSSETVLKKMIDNILSKYFNHGLAQGLYRQKIIFKYRIEKYFKEEFGDVDHADDVMQELLQYLELV